MSDFFCSAKIACRYWLHEKMFKKIDLQKSIHQSGYKFDWLLLEFISSPANLGLVIRASFKLWLISVKEVVLLKHPGPPLIWEGGPVCFSRSYWRFLAQNWKSYENQIQNQWGKTHLFSYIDLQWNSVLTSFPRIFVFILTLQPNLTKFCSPTLAGESPRTPWWTLGCLKTQT